VAEHNPSPSSLDLEALKRLTEDASANDGGLILLDSVLAAMLRSGLSDRQVADIQHVLENLPAILATLEPIPELKRDDRLTDATDLSSLTVALGVCAPSQEFPNGIQGRFSGAQCAVLLAALERIPELVRQVTQWSSAHDEALERAERIESALRTCALIRCLNPVEYVPYPASVIWRDCGKCATCSARTALAAAPPDEASTLDRVTIPSNRYNQLIRVEKEARELLVDLKHEYGWDDGTPLELALDAAPAPGEKVVSSNG